MATQRLKPEQRAYLKVLLTRLCGVEIIRPANIIDAIGSDEFSTAFVRFLNENDADRKAQEASAGRGNNSEPPASPLPT